MALYYGLFHNGDQIGFQCFANYIPRRPGAKLILHSNRTVIHPDYVGLGLGRKLINETCVLVKREYDCKIMACFSSTPIFKALSKSKFWNHIKTEKRIKHVPFGGGLSSGRAKAIRQSITMHTFEYIA